MINYQQLKRTVQRQIDLIKRGYVTCPQCYGIAWVYVKRGHGVWIIEDCPSCKGVGLIKPEDEK
jgi:phage FluMu protein Com